MLFGLGIRHVGQRAARFLAAEFGSLERLMEAGNEELEAVGEIGPKTAEALRCFFEQPANRELIGRLARSGRAYGGLGKCPGGRARGGFSACGHDRRRDRDAAGADVVRRGQGDRSRRSGVAWRRASAARPTWWSPGRRPGRSWPKPGSWAFKRHRARRVRTVRPEQRGPILSFRRTKREIRVCPRLESEEVSEQGHIIVVEDDEGNRRTVTRALKRDGYRVASFGSATPALEHLRANRDVVLVITDLMLPGVDGFGVLEETKSINPDVGVLMITGHGSVESAVDAMKRGADDYLTKPVDLFELRKRTSAIVEKHRLSRRVDELESRLGEKFKLVAQSKPMHDLFRQMELVAPARSNVLITGESGTGKELVANALHENSPRCNKRFLPINCAAIPAEILESELFGHERGAFTGAAARKPGKFELADGGTLFLDEIGELPLEMQVKLLRVLEQREFMRVGGSETIKVDIRVVAATNSDLETAVEQRPIPQRPLLSLEGRHVEGPSVCASGARTSRCCSATSSRSSPPRTRREGMHFGADAMRLLVGGAMGRQRSGAAQPRRELGGARARSPWSG